MFRRVRRLSEPDTHRPDAEEEAQPQPALPHHLVALDPAHIAALPPLVAPAPIIMANAVNGNDMKQLPLFDGSTGNVRIMAESWVFQMEDLAGVYNWTQAQKATVAKHRLTGEAREWMMLQRRMGYPMNAWDAAAAADREPTFKYQFIREFMGAPDARGRQSLAKCKPQGPTEPVKKFRIRLGNHLQQKYSHLTEAQRGEQAHIDAVKKELFDALCQGIRPDLYRRTIGVAGSDYQEVGPLVAAVTQIEECDASEKVMRAQVSEIFTEAPADNDAPKEEATISSLTKEIASLKEILAVGRGGGGPGKGRGRGRGGGPGRGGGQGRNNDGCWKCGDPNHWKNECPVYPGNSGGNYKGGRGGYGSGQGRGGGNQGGQYRKFNGSYARGTGGRRFKIYEVYAENGDLEYTEVGEEETDQSAGNA